MKEEEVKIAAHRHPLRKMTGVKKYVNSLGEFIRRADVDRLIEEPFIDGAELVNFNWESLKKRIDDGEAREAIAAIEEKLRQIDTITGLLKKVVYVWGAPIAERCKPDSVRMTDVVHEIKNHLNT